MPARGARSRALLIRAPPPAESAGRRVDDVLRSGEAAQLSPMDARL